MTLQCLSSPIQSGRIPIRRLKVRKINSGFLSVAANPFARTPMGSTCPGPKRHHDESPSCSDLCQSRGGRPGPSGRTLPERAGRGRHAVRLETRIPWNRPAWWLARAAFALHGREDVHEADLEDAHLHRRRTGDRSALGRRRRASRPTRARGSSGSRTTRPPTESEVAPRPPEAAGLLGLLPSRLRRQRLRLRLQQRARGTPRSA